VIALTVAIVTSRAAHATVTEPNGVVVPTDGTGGGEMRLDAFFAAAGELIDWRADAFSTPATFSPLCGFRATLERVDSGSKFGVGWYNVVPNATTPPTRVFPIIPRNATPGQVFTGDDIRSSADYAGGLIGFALIREGGTPAYHYAENQWNTQCNTPVLCVTPGPWTLSLTYQSKSIPNAWYMGFEDGNTSTATWNNDGDFNDSLFLFEGLTCAGGGEPCEVAGAEGVCRAGLTECVGSGALSCKQVVLPDAEKCDGIDNDCNGDIDEGNLCPPEELCFQGRCVPNCSRSEFPCRAGKVCVQGVCVDRACAETTCASGQACIDGECIAPCDGVVCPGDQECLLGRCIDLCEGVACGGGRVCEGGVCVESCDCRGCDSTLACQRGSHPSAGRCVPPGCVDRSCGPGEACTAATNGACAPLCAVNVVCPREQICEAGACVPAPQADGGTGSGGGTGTGGRIFVDTGGSPGSGGSPARGGSPAGGSVAGTSSGSGADATGHQKVDCGCRVAAPADEPGPRLLGLLALGVLAAWRRRTPFER
jgi:MYXO-CTERM domain-containing protein